jgi:hypothetical protein
MLSVNVCSLFQILNKLIKFNEIWYGRCTIRGHSIAYILIFYDQ